MSLQCNLREEFATTREQCEAMCTTDDCISMWSESDPSSNPDRYFYIFDRMTWDEANDFCKRNNSRLAVVRSWQDHEELRQIVSGLSQRMASRIGDALVENAPTTTAKMAGNLAKGLSVFFARNAWIGMRTQPTTGNPDYKYEFKWEGEPDLDNLQTGGAPFPNAYKWGWSVKYYKPHERQFTNEPKCGSIERRMWERRDCNDHLPFICERLGKCEVCDGSEAANLSVRLNRSAASTESPAPPNSAESSTVTENDAGSPSATSTTDVQSNSSVQVQTPSTPQQNQNATPVQTMPSLSVVSTTPQTQSPGLSGIAQTLAQGSNALSAGLGGGRQEAELKREIVQLLRDIMV